jgi:hypothetical protein
MHEVEISRFVAATRPELDRHLSPATVIEYEGTFTVVDVTDIEDGTAVTGRGGGMDVVFEFEPREEGYAYAQQGEKGPFETMRTTLSLTRENEGTVVTARSQVSLGLPAKAVTDRVAAWKRRGELERALDRLAAEFD